MMRINTEPQKVWEEYEKAMQYNQSIGLQETVKKNENFYIGKQWEGVNAPDLDKPVFNILKRVCNMFIAQIVSDDITASVEPFTDDGTSEAAMKIIAKEIERAIEYSDAKNKNRDVLRNACVDGDGCFYMYFDADTDIGQTAKGVLNIDVVDNTNVFFGNPYSCDTQKQPYIIILQRRTVDSVKAEAKANGIKDDDISLVQPDSNQSVINEDYDTSLVSVLIKLWKENGTLHCVKTTKDITLKKAWDTGYSLYPIAYMSWDKIKNSYHGQAAVTGLIPNQIFINKCYAMGMDYVKKHTFPKLIYDKNRLPTGWDNRIGRAIAVEGNVSEAVASAFKMPDMSASVMELVEKTMTYTKEYMGASDATLGNIRPDNASAIVAVQKASNAPLELQKMAFFKFVEEYIRIFLDIMRVDYGLREVGRNENGVPIHFDFSVLDQYSLNLNVNVGASAYWSEIMQVQTADNLFANGVITDPELYLEAIPNAYVKNRQKIIDDIRAKKELAQLQQAGENMPMEGASTESVLMPAAAEAMPMGKTMGG